MIGVTLPDMSRPEPAATDVPRLRGWVHLGAFVVSLAVGGALVGVAFATGRTDAAWPVLVYALGMSALFGTSALYHRRRWRDRARAWMRRLDHAVIFLFIACTYTPFAVLALPPESAVPLLAVVWGGAVIGAAIEFARPVGRRWFLVPLYLALGWVALPVIGTLASALGPIPVILLAAGGIVYTIGALLYAARWPNPWPRTFGHHEIFHTATVLAAGSHAVAVWIVAIG
jgi:hemolysin III